MSSLGRFHRFTLQALALVAFVAGNRLELPPSTFGDEKYNETIIPSLTLPKYVPVPPEGPAIPPTTASGAQPPDEFPGLPAPLLARPSALTVPAPTFLQTDQARYQLPFRARVFGGGSYFDTPAQTSFGGLYGGSLALPLTRRLKLMGTGWGNSYTGGTQYGGTIGGYLKPTYYGSTLQRFGGRIAFDQFTDTKLGSPYLSQAQFEVNYKVLPLVTVGALYMDPLSGAKSPTVVPGAFGPPLRTFQVVQGQLTVGEVMFAVGYVDVENSMTYSLYRSHRVDHRFSCSGGVTYDERIGLWTGFVGVSMTLNPRRRDRWVANSDYRQRGRDVVRGDVMSVIASVLLLDGSGFLFDPDPPAPPPPPTDDSSPYPDDDNYDPLPYEEDPNNQVDPYIPPDDDDPLDTPYLSIPQLTRTKTHQIGPFNVTTGTPF